MLIFFSTDGMMLLFITPLSHAAGLQNYLFTLSQFHFDLPILMRFRRFSVPQAAKFSILIYSAPELLRSYRAAFFHALQFRRAWLRSRALPFAAYCFARSLRQARSTYRAAFPPRALRTVI